MTFELLCLSLISSKLQKIQKVKKNDPRLFNTSLMIYHNVITIDGINLKEIKEEVLKDLEKDKKC